MSDLAAKIENARKEVADLKAKIKQNRKNKQDAERKSTVGAVAAVLGRLGAASGGRFFFFASSFGAAQAPRMSTVSAHWSMIAC